MTRQVSVRQSGDQSNTARLCFDSQDDALDFARRSVEKSQNWLARNSLDFAKRYKEGELEIVIHLSVVARAEEYDLVFFAVPVVSGDRSASRDSHIASMKPGGGRAHRDDEPMIAFPANPVECPNYVVPSFVRVETPKEREDIRWEILAIASESIFKLSGRVGDGKMNTIGSASSRGNSDRVHRLIEGGSQAIDHIVGEVGVPVGKQFRESDFVKLVNAIRVGLNETHVWFFLEKLLDPSIKIANLFLCPRDPSFRAIEWISYGEEASV